MTEYVPYPNHLEDEGELEEGVWFLKSELRNLFTMQCKEKLRVPLTMPLLGREAQPVKNTMEAGTFCCLCLRA